MNLEVNQLIIFASIGGTTLSEYTEFVGAVPTWTKSYTYLGDGVLSTISNLSGAESTEFNHPDRLGTRVITNQTAGTNSEQTTLPFGTALNAESTTSLTKRFTSYERSQPTGLDYAINRTYDSKQGRFTQVDPIGMSAASLGSPQTLNLYTYCGNDPINHTDPDGLFWGFFKKLFKWVMIAITVVVAVMTIVAAPATLIGILGAISAGANAASQVLNAIGLRKAGMIFGIIAMVAGFGSIIAGKIGAGNFASGDSKNGLAGAWFGTLGGVGAIANSLMQTKDKKKKRPGKYQTVDQAAIAILKDWNPISILQDREWAGSICERINGEIFTTPPKIGTKDSSNVGDCPVGTTRVGTYHTHGAYDPNYNNENFSVTDRSNANNRSLREGNVVPNYVATPNGAIKKFTPAVIRNSTRGKVTVFNSKTSTVFVP